MDKIYVSVRIITCILILWVGFVGIQIRDKYIEYSNRLSMKTDPVIYHEVVCNLSIWNQSKEVFYMETLPLVKYYVDKYGRMPTPNDLETGRYSLCIVFDEWNRPIGCP